MNLRDVIYLDNAFIVESYENVFGKEVPTKYSKTTDVSLGIKINMIAKAGASLKETFEYPINTHEMYRKISSELDKIAEISLFFYFSIASPMIIIKTGNFEHNKSK